MNVEQDQQRQSKTLKYRVKRLRRGSRDRISRWLARRFGTDHPASAPLDAPPRRILVIRLNKRLGNALFLTPLLRSLALTFPEANIDVLIRGRPNAALLTGLPGMDRVWVLPKGICKLIGLVRGLRRRGYDLAIDPTLESANNRSAMLLCGARQRLGFASRDQWLRLTHAAPTPADEPHQARQGPLLLTQALTGLQPVIHEHISVAPDTAAQAEANRHWQTALPQRPAGAPVIGFFAQATDAKQLPEDWWREWLAALRAENPKAAIIQLLPPDETPPLEAGLPHLRIAELDVLAAALAHLDGFVAADSGPMHLAAASGVPVIGLFRATDPRHYAPMGAGCHSLTGAELEPERAARMVLGAAEGG